MQRRSKRLRHSGKLHRRLQSGELEFMPALMHSSHRFMQQYAFILGVIAATLPSCKKARCITGPQASRAFKNIQIQHQFQEILNRSK